MDPKLAHECVPKVGYDTRVAVGYNRCWKAEPAKPRIPETSGRVRRSVRGTSWDEDGEF